MTVGAELKSARCIVFSSAHLFRERGFSRKCFPAAQSQHGLFDHVIGKTSQAHAEKQFVNGRPGLREEKRFLPQVEAVADSPQPHNRGNIQKR